MRYIFGEPPAHNKEMALTSRLHYSNEKNLSGQTQIRELSLRRTLPCWSEGNQTNLSLNKRWISLLPTKQGLSKTAFANWLVRLQRNASDNPPDATRATHQSRSNDSFGHVRHHRRCLMAALAMVAVHMNESLDQLWCRHKRSCS